MTDYDLVVIGSGPAAVAALDAIGSRLRIAVIDGAVPTAAKGLRLNPKIQAVASSEGEAPGIAEILQPASRGKSLFSTAAVGGLANYWGQQFLPAQPKDPWPKELFSDHADFMAECGTVETRFRMLGGLPLENAAFGSAGFSIFTTRLLVGAATSSNDDSRCRPLSAMKHAFLTAAAANNATTFTGRAASFKRVKGGWAVLLDNGAEISGERIVLAAGVIGNARILFRSYGDLAAARFRDHTPWMLYTFGLPSFLPARLPRQQGHFNTATLEKTEDGSTAIYASVYDMQYADLNLLTATTIGVTSRLLSRLGPPRIASLINPVQLWTAATTEHVELHSRDGAVFHSSPNCDARPEIDDGLKTTIGALKAAGARVLRASRTSPGYGFHYHALELQEAEKPFQSVADLLAKRTAGEVICVDASTLASISQRPHTLTAMASARRLMHQF